MNECFEGLNEKECFSEYSFVIRILVYDIAIILFGNRKYSVPINIQLYEIVGQRNYQMEIIIW
jgi:hypothetical protein